MVWVRAKTCFNWMVIKGLLERRYLSWNVNDNWNRKSVRVSRTCQELGGLNLLGREEQRRKLCSLEDTEETVGEEHLSKKYSVVRILGI